MRLQTETVAEFELFGEYCRIPPSSRNLPNFVRRTGVGFQRAKNLSKKHNWSVRAMAFDDAALALRPDPKTMDEEASAAGQLIAAHTLIDLGMSVLAMKDPSMITVKQAVELTKIGTEMHRKALGEADQHIKVTKDDISRVVNFVDELFEGKVIEEAEVVDDV